METAVFCERIRTARHEKWMSQTDLARRAGINRSLLNKYEHGVQRPVIDNLIAIARALDCSLDWLVGLED